MRTVSRAEARRWLAELGLVSPDGRFSIASPSGALRYRIPVDSGKKTGLSQMLASFFDVEGESLLVIHEHGVFPSCEDRVLFDGFRRSLGEHAPVHEKPGHVFTKGDLKYVGSLLAMVLYFVWGALVVPEDGSFVVEISHDEVIDIYGDGEVLGRIKERLDSLLGASAYLGANR